MIQIYHVSLISDQFLFFMLRHNLTDGKTLQSSKVKNFIKPHDLFEHF